ncbi:tripeptidyl-peptidase 1 precursor [Rhizodiscina lignyota]|uniref:tripeptidyl-peptidase II n=1 Tax=Rhizodiscina lignyota TaxID=1504668 RepID=A0A9P4M487_9PEZI|nr:tripeptidyl-peptidase 1 precursor [Rhizodiscina lignyota]
MRSPALFGAVCLGLFSGLLAANPLKSRYAVKETHTVPQGYRRVADAPGHRLIRLQVGLKQNQFDELERRLYEVSDPDHDYYGQHLSIDEINELVKPSDDTFSLVQEWLLQHVDPRNIGYSTAKDFIFFTLPIAEVERLLDTKYSVYQHDDGSTLVRTPAWSLPLHLHDHITAIQPTTSFLRTVPQSKTFLNGAGGSLSPQPYQPIDNPTVGNACNTSAVTPLCLRTLYETVDYVPKVPGKNVLGFTNYLGEVNLRSDAEQYLQTYRPDAVSAAYTFSQISVDGGTLQQTPLNTSELQAGIGIEGGLDVQTLLGLGYPTPLVAYSTGGTPPPFTPDADDPTVDNEPYLEWLNYMLGQPFVPQVISNSYEDNEQTVPESYAKVVCSQFAQLGARGVSIFFGSGDGGTGGVQPGGSCLSNVNNKTEFIPLFPSSCPFVTSVGATVNFNPEVVAFDPHNNFTSGGGFSNYFPQPSYQAEAVAGYLKTIGNEFSSLYNKSGRAYPDIAAYGVNYTVIWNGTLRRTDGTSASTPTAAAVFSLLNDALLAAGKPVMGFLNPWLYKKGHQAFTDVTSGEALFCDNVKAFPAVKGWDAVTGFGTPRFEKLLKAVGL